MKPGPCCAKCKLAVSPKNLVLMGALVYHPACAPEPIEEDFES